MGVGVSEAVSRRADDRVGLGSGAVCVGEGTSAGTDDRVGLGSGAVCVGEGASAGTDERVGLGSGAVTDGVSARSGDRVGLGSVAVGLGSELGWRDDVGVGRSTEPVSPQELSRRAATAKPTARIMRGSETALSDPAVLSTLLPLRPPQSRAAESLVRVLAMPRLLAICT